MKRVITAALLGLCLATPAMASKELAQAKNCLGCHAVDSKVVAMTKLSQERLITRVIDRNKALE